MNNKNLPLTQISTSLSGNMVCLGGFWVHSILFNLLLVPMILCHLLHPFLLPKLMHWISLRFAFILTVYVSLFCKRWQYTTNMEKNEFQKLTNVWNYCTEEHKCWLRFICHFFCLFWQEKVLTNVFQDLKNHPAGRYVSYIT